MMGSGVLMLICIYQKRTTSECASFNYNCSVNNFLKDNTILFEVSLRANSFISYQRLFIVRFHDFMHKLVQTHIICKNLYTVYI